MTSIALPLPTLPHMIAAASPPDQPLPRHFVSRPLRNREYTPGMSWLMDRLARARPSSDADLVERLREGDERAFEELVDRYGAMMLRVARLYVRDRAVAEEVVQETWLAVLNGIDSFEGRSSLKTWIFRILANRAKTRAQREGRTVPVSALMAADAAAGEPSVDPDRFFDLNQDHAFGWAAPPRDWPQRRVLAKETLDVIERAIESLPETQQTVIRLRDVEGWSPAEVSEALEITDGNQRVLLHRARSKVRAAVEEYLDPELSK
jgi:RNA polymerase sigma-70 factor, ECF subfamily